MITEDYTSFETAKLLKKSGFDSNEISCIKVFKGHTYKIQGTIIDADEDVTIPTIQLAMKWLREVYNIAICISAYYAIDPYELNHRDNKPYWKIRIMNRISSRDYDSFNTYEEACEAGIRYCLEKLI